MSATLAKLLTGDILDRVAYAPHNIAAVQLFYGVPPVSLSGLDYVFAMFDNPQNVLKMGLGSSGRFVPNRNQSGTIEFALIDGSISNGIVQLGSETKIPFPIVVQDTRSAGTSYISAESCMLVSTPEWRKELTVGMKVYTFKTKKLTISTGIKKPE